MAIWWVKDDCCGVFCGVTTNLLLFYAAFVQFYFVLGPWWGYIHPITLSYLCLTSMACLCHFRTQFTNPGAVPLDNEDLIDLENQNLTSSSSKNRRYCKTCQQYKPFDAHHCSTCHRCIIRMDHHCPWVNNCVAMFNQKYFVLFCFYTALCCLFCISSLITRFLICQSHKTGTGSNHSGILKSHIDGINQIVANDIVNDETYVDDNNLAAEGMSTDSDMAWCRGQGLDVMFCIINLFEGILFGLFTMIMSCDQVSSIISNVTYIDTLTMSRKTLQKKKKEASSMENLTFVFGEPFSINWFLPYKLTPKIKQNFKDLCMQF